LRFHRLDFLLNGFEHGGVVVDDEIEDGVENVVLAPGQRPRAAFASFAHRLVGHRGAVPDRHDISFADEQMRLAEGDAVAVELRGARDDEQRVAILLDLWPLMGVVGILDRKVMQPELPLHAAEHRHVGLAQADPDHVVGLAAPARCVVDGDVGDASAFDIDAGRDHAVFRRYRFWHRGGRRCNIHGFLHRSLCTGLFACSEASTRASGVKWNVPPASRPILGRRAY
jgi:hypothetical protein